MAHFNKVVLLGNLTRDPEVRNTTSGAAVCNFSLAINREWKTETGEKKSEVSFIEVAAFGKPAEIVAKYARKGKQILIEGRLRQEVWDDKVTGKQRSKVMVVLESFQLLGRPDEPGSVPAPRANHPPAEHAHHPELPHPAEPDDVPF